MVYHLSTSTRSIRLSNSATTRPVCDMSSNVLDHDGLLSLFIRCRVEPRDGYVYHVTACRHLPPRVEPGQPLPTAAAAKYQVTSRLASFLTRLPSLALQPPPEEDDVALLTEYLTEAVQHRAYEGLVSAGVHGQAVTRLELPRINDGKTHVMLQVRFLTTELSRSTKFLDRRQVSLQYNRIPFSSRALVAVSSSASSLVLLLVVVFS